MPRQVYNTQDTLQRLVDFMRHNHTTEKQLEYLMQHYDMPQSTAYAFIKRARAKLKRERKK